ncbi:MAG: GIY-YIG nuclease family protein [Chitinophagaceae bacterium]|nr:GIY-YIG nuclease family protein [Chitinophagaceae bacterium]
MFYIYILFSRAFDKFYIGYTRDYRQRLIQHNTQDFHHTFTSKYRPWELAAVFEAGTHEGEVMKLEKFIKKQKSRRLLEQLSDSSFIPTGYLAQLVRVPHVRD